MQSALQRRSPSGPYLSPKKSDATAFFDQGQQENSIRDVSFHVF